MMSPPTTVKKAAAGSVARPAQSRPFDVVAAGIAGALAGGIVAEAMVSWLQSRRRSLPGRLVDAGGRRLHMRIAGDAQGPTVIFEAGLGGSSVLWALVQDDVAQFARTCSYDRAGYGYSDFGRLPRTGAQLAAELHLALEHAGLAPPYVLVAHSYGGVIARLFAGRHPRDVAGIVFVDALHGAIYDEAHVVMRHMIASFGVTLGGLALLSTLGVLRFAADVFGPEAILGLRTLPPAVRRELADSMPRDVIAALFELFSWETTLDLAEATPLLPDLPIIALAHDSSQTFAAAGRDATRYERLWQDIQSGTVRLSRRVKLVRAQQSGHHIALDDPADVVSAIRSILDSEAGRSTA